jgi:low affinity Fe/Cu permease
MSSREPRWLPAQLMSSGHRQDFTGGGPAGKESPDVPSTMTLLVAEGPGDSSVSALSSPHSPRGVMTRQEGTHKRPFGRRTAQLPATSRLLYRIDHHSSRPSASLVVVGLLAALLVVGIILGFPSGWVIGSEVGMSSVTLVMVFAIQHTQAREQAASQRKLDELLRAIPGAQERFMMLEEAPDSVLRDVVEDQRGHHDEIVALDGRSADPAAE